MKAVLVIDMPEKCYKCPYFSHDTAVGFNCVISCGRHIEVPQEHSDWCLFRPLPEKQYGNLFVGTSLEPLYDSFRDGWNACLDVIMGGEE